MYTERGQSSIDLVIGLLVFLGVTAIVITTAGAGLFPDQADTADPNITAEQASNEITSQIQEFDRIGLSEEKIRNLDEDIDNKAIEIKFLDRDKDEIRINEDVIEEHDGIHTTHTRIEGQMIEMTVYIQQ